MQLEFAQRKAESEEQEEDLLELFAQLPDSIGYYQYTDLGLPTE